jgi:hypothetical protein
VNLRHDDSPGNQKINRRYPDGSVKNIPFGMVSSPAADGAGGSWNGHEIRRGKCPSSLASKIWLLVRHIIERKKQPMDVPLKSSRGLARGIEPKTEASKRLFQQQVLQRIWTTMSLINLSLGFSVFGILIIAKRQQADLNGSSGDSFVAAVGGIGGLVIGIGFLVAACLHRKIISGPSGGHCTRLDRVATA